MLLGAFLLLNHFGKPACRGDDVSVKDFQGHLVTFKRKRERKQPPTSNYIQMIANMLNTVFVSEAKILYN